MRRRRLSGWILVKKGRFAWPHDWRSGRSGQVANRIRKFAAKISCWFFFFPTDTVGRPSCRHVFIEVAIVLTYETDV
jgi:hypothetical protein